ncbi:MAG: hypothetical protein JJE22_20450, partial [Bacteroidia bacterium]|nr:hypothetical protein [Bacteroidia bacterium]
SNKKDSSVFLNSSDISRKQRDKKKNTFFLSFSTAPDVSVAGSGKAGKLKFTYGAGLGFTYHNKFTLRTGFYTGRKIYSASPGEYHPPASFWSYYPNLENVDADCRVYEIPLLLSYNFGNSLKQNWFGTAGLSSYLMKRETYQYTYKNASGQYMYNDWTINNQNKHYFSVLTLSAGYQRNINQTFSLMVEPYLKIPLSGIGYGNVKLNSAGLLFSAAIKPFGTNSKIRKTKSSGTN